MPTTYANWIVILDDGRGRLYLLQGTRPGTRIDHGGRAWQQVAANPNVGVASYAPAETGK